MLVGLQQRKGEVALLLTRDLDQGEIEVIVDGGDLDVLDHHALQGAIRLREPRRDAQVGLALNDVGVRDRIALCVQDHARADAAGRGDFDDAGPDALGLFLGAQFGQVRGRREQCPDLNVDDRSVLDLDLIDVIDMEGQDLRPDVDPDPPIAALEDNARNDSSVLERDHVPGGEVGQDGR